MPLNDFQCEKCGSEVIDFIHNEGEAPQCFQCEERMAKKFPLIWGYRWVGGCGGSSTTPKKYEDFPG